MHIAGIEDLEVWKRAVELSGAHLRKVQAVRRSEVTTEAGSFAGV